jgi:putative tricarboxylic transport membrane protein
MVPVGIALQRLCMRAVIVPPPVLVAGVLALSTLGSYAGNLSLSEAVHALIFGVVGCLMQRFGFPIPAVVLGMVLGFTMEGEFRRSLMMSFGSPMIFLSRPIAAALMGLTAIVLLRPLVSRAWASLGATGRGPRPPAEAVSA